MIHEFPIHREHIPAFRAALREVADSQVAEAGEQGEIIFLDTKTFEQDYMEFCDKFAANSFYPPHARSEMRRRRNAIFPFLGRPLLHGGLSHDGFRLNVFVEKAPGVVIHWELCPADGAGGEP